MRLLLIFLLLSPVFALQIGGDFLVAVDFSITGGGNGEITVVEYPGNFSGQTGYCSSTEISFPPYNPSLVCDVERFPKKNPAFEDYENGNLTEVDAQMSALARQLIAGDVEKFDKAVSIALWVRENIQYDLGVGDTQQNAKWTYYSKIGTCDELAHLFIALSRSVGLTSRYISGYVYDGDKWLPHAWAEVWTRYGWAPIDVAFDQYGYVDGNHIATYKGRDGDHNFILIYYFGQASVAHAFNIQRLGELNASLVESSEVDDAAGNSSTLVALRINNPFPTMIAFQPDIIAPKDFRGELLYPTDKVILNPGANTLYMVLKVQRIRQDYSYTIPVTVRLGSETVPIEFRVSGNHRCPDAKEAAPYSYDVSGCIDLNTRGQAVSPASSGSFFCDPCFYSFEEPTSRSYQLEYPDFCEENCTISIEVVGSGKYSIDVNGQLKQGFADIYQLVEFPLVIGNNTVTIDGVSREIEVSSPPALELSHEFDGAQVCFASNWQGAGCHRLSCGNNTVEFELKYGRLKKTVHQEIARECNFLEQVIEFFTNMFGT